MNTEDLGRHNRGLETVTGEERQLHKYLAEGEHQRQDFKFRIDSSQKIAKTLSAFANTDGGRLLIGVKDNGRIAGVDPQEEFYMIEGAAEVYCRPPIGFATSVYLSEEKLVLQVDIPVSPHSPHYARDENNRWIAYVRQDDENFMANRVLLQFLQNKHPGPRKNQLNYGAHERKLFDYLSENSDISLSKFAKITGVSLHQAEKTLALFLNWEIIDWRATEKGIRFFLIG